MCVYENTSIVQQIVDYRDRSETEEAVTLVGTVWLYTCTENYMFKSFRGHDLHCYMKSV